MAIHILTDRSAELLARFRELIDKGHIKTWSYDKDGDFTHTTAQWRFKAWLRPQVRPGELLLNILAPKDAGMTKSTYGIYHGRFIESVLTHLDVMCSGAQASAMAESGDRIGVARPSG